MALVKGVEKVVEAEGFDLSFLKEKIKELNDAGILENKVKVVAVSKPVMVDSFLKAIEAIPEGSAEEKAIPKDVTILYNAYVDVLEDKSLVIPVVVKEGFEVGGPVKKEKIDIPRVTKKSIIIDILNAGGGTVDEMAVKITEAGLGDFDRNRKTAGLWLRKIGFPTKKEEDGIWVKA